MRARAFGGLRPGFGSSGTASPSAGALGAEGSIAVPRNGRSRTPLEVFFQRKLADIVTAALLFATMSTPLRVHRHLAS